MAVKVRAQFLPRSKAHARAHREKKAERLAELLEGPAGGGVRLAPHSHEGAPRPTVRSPQLQKPEGPEWAACGPEAVLADLAARGMFLTTGARHVYRA